MISLISGKIISNNGAEVVIMTAGGVGYKVAVNVGQSDAWQVGSETTLLTYLVVREDALDLYGFKSETERRLFLNFISVSGIGPKSALHLLSLGSVEEIVTAIGRGDVAYLTKVSGVGKKTAERIVIELKDKVGKGVKGEDIGTSDELNDVIDGLITLGYSSAEAREAVKKLNVSGKSSEQLLKEALQRIK